MWVIGKVNQVQKKYIESLGGQFRQVDNYDVEKVVGAVNKTRDNEEMVVVYIEGDMIEDLKLLNQIKEDSKQHKDIQGLHEERLYMLEALWEEKRSELQVKGAQIEDSEDWVCDGDTYSMAYDTAGCGSFIDNTSYGTVVFNKGSVSTKSIFWDCD